VCATGTGQATIFYLLLLLGTEPSTSGFKLYAPIHPRVRTESEGWSLHSNMNKISDYGYGYSFGKFNSAHGCGATAYVPIM
jgi:hypothetical protein